MNYSQLVELQALPLKEKINISKQRIKEFYKKFNGKVYVAFSGGKDSTVLLHLVRTLYPDTIAVFCNTGLEFPEIVEFVKTTDNVQWLKPRFSFKEVLEKYGYPVVSKEVSQRIYEIRNTKSEKLRKIRLEGYNNKFHSGRLPFKWRYLIDAPFKISHKCCFFLKKDISYRFEKQTGLAPYLGEMAVNSIARKQKYLKEGCNNFKSKRPQSLPLGFWEEADVWEYIKQFKLPYSKIYDMGYQNTGCVFCMFGVHLDKFNKFQQMKTTHPKLYNYCINKLGCGEVLDYLNVPYKKEALF